MSLPPNPDPEAAFQAALQRKAPDPITSDRQIARLKNAAERWLQRNDPNAKKNKRIAKLRKQRAARQTRIHRRR
jgi:hypothetical protein